MNDTISLLLSLLNDIFSDNGTCGVLDVLMTDYTDMEQIKSEIKMFGGAVSREYWIYVL